MMGSIQQSHGPGYFRMTSRGVIAAMGSIKNFLPSYHLTHFRTI
jgi:hypothetical protein